MEPTAENFEERKAALLTEVAALQDKYQITLGAQQQTVFTATDRFIPTPSVVPDGSTSMNEVSEPVEPAATSEVASDVTQSAITDASTDTSADAALANPIA